MQYKKLLIPTLVAVAVLAGATAINAQTATTTTNPMAALATAIAQKFNLNVDEVQSVLDETREAQHAEMEAQHQQAFATRLAQAVTDGKLTQAQADLITTKSAELRASMESNRTTFESLTPEERKTKMEAQRTELESWATANNIPLEYLHFVGKGKGFGGHHGFGEKAKAF